MQNTSVCMYVCMYVLRTTYRALSIKCYGTYSIHCAENCTV